MSVQLPDEVIQAWGRRGEPLVLTTVGNEGMPNAIYASMVSLMADGRIAVADNYFDKTLTNIQRGSTAAILFISKDHQAYQVKGSVEYHSSGPVYDEMRTWADPKHPRKGVAVLNAEAVYRGTDQLA